MILLHRLGPSRLGVRKAAPAGDVWPGPAQGGPKAGCPASSGAGRAIAKLSSDSPAMGPGELALPG